MSKKTSKYCIHCGSENKKNQIKCRVCQNNINEMDENIKNYFYGEIEGNISDSIKNLIIAFIKKHLYGVLLTLTVVSVTIPNILKDDSKSNPKIVNSRPTIIKEVNSSENSSDLYSGLLKVGNYTLEYGKYEGLFSSGGTDGSGTVVREVMELRNDGTYTEFFEDEFTFDGTYKVTDTDVYEKYGVYRGIYGLEFENGSILVVRNNNEIETIAGSQDKYRYIGK